MIRRRAEINNGHFTYIFGGIIPLCHFQYRNRVHSIHLIPFKIISRSLAQIYVQRLTTVTPSTFLAELFPFVIFSIEIVSTL